jgi:hypothetical protein
MANSRYDKMALGTTYINKLATHSSDSFVKAKEDLMKTGHAVFVEAYNQRENTRKARVEAVKQLEEIDKELITLLSKVSKIILVDIPRTDLKIKDFFINGTVSNIIKGNYNEQILSVKHLISGFEKYPEYDFSVKYTNQMKTVLEKLEESYKIVLIAREAEEKALRKLKEEEDNYDSLLRKIANFISNEITD